MERLINVNDVSLNFNLRQPQGNKSTNVYCVLKCGRVQYKYAIGCKCNSYQWNKRQQLPIVNANMTADDMANNIKVANIINQIKFGYMNFYSYLCSAISMTENEIKESITNIINESISNDMANENNLQKGKGKSPKATTLLQKAFNVYYSEVKPNTKDSSKKAEKIKLNAFKKYCEEIGKDGISMLTQKGLNDYKTYLIKNGESAVSINLKCRCIKKYINEVIAVHNDFLKYHIAKVEYNNIERPKVDGDEKKRRPLSSEELNILMGADNLTPKEKEYRDLFVLECNCSYRVSDTEKLFDKTKQKREKRGDNEFIVIDTKKENITAVIWVNDVVRTILDRYENGFKYVKFNTRYQRNLNKTLKSIFEKLSLSEEKNWKDAKGVLHTDKLSDIITSHFARYTFINHCFDIGMTSKEIIDFSGHANEEMVNEVYAIRTSSDKVDNAHKALQRIGIIKSENNVESNTNINAAQLIEKGKIEYEKELIKEYKDVLVYLGANYMDIADINDLDRLFALTYCDYGNRLNEIGIDLKDLKKIYNLPYTTLKEKREILTIIISFINENLHNASEKEKRPIIENLVKRLTTKKVVK